MEINKLVDDLAGGVTETPPEAWTPGYLGRFVSSTGSPCWAARLAGPDGLRMVVAAPDENHFCFSQLVFFLGDSDAWQAAAFETWPKFLTLVLLRFQSFPSPLLSGTRKDFPVCVSHCGHMEFRLPHTSLAPPPPDVCRLLIVVLPLLLLLSSSR